MSVVKIRAALETALNGMSPALSTAWENAPFTPPAAATAYQKCHVLFAEPDNPTFGDGMRREQGVMQVTLMYPLQTGPKAASDRAELIRSTFSRGSSFSNGGVTATIARTPEVSPGAVDGDRWAVPVKIRFYSTVFS